MVGVLGAVPAAGSGVAAAAVTPPDLPTVEEFGALATTREPASRAAEAQAAARLVRRRVPDPGERAEILAALGLPAEPAPGL